MKRCHKEYTCARGKLYHLPLKMYGKCKKFLRKTNRQIASQTDRAKPICPQSIDEEALKYLYDYKAL